MDVKKKKIISILLKLGTMVFAVVGVVLGCVVPFGAGYMTGLRNFLYFTTDCNALIALFFLYGLYVDVYDFVKGNVKARRVYYAVKHILTVGMVITGIFFYLMVIGLPIIDGDLANCWNFISFPSNWTVHFAAPTLVIFDYLFFDVGVDKNDTKKVGFLSLVHPTCYAVIIIILSLNGVKFSSEGAVVPYIFLDYTLIPLPLLIVLWVVIGVAIYYLSHFLIWSNKKLSKVG